MTRDQFLTALRVLDEGRPEHSMYAIEDAKHLLKPVAGYWWRQAAILTFAVVVALQIVPHLLPSWPRLIAFFTAAMASSAATWIIMRIPHLRGFFAPPGLTATDVAKAAVHVFA